MTVNEILAALIANPDQRISIRGKLKNIVGFAEFRTINLGDDGYFKLIFDDHSFMFIIPSEEALYYTDDGAGRFDEIADEDIGNVQQLTLRGKTYVLDNPHDYQYVVRLIKGGPNTIEGEVKFSDYVPNDGSNEILSLGWVVRTGERADVNPKELDPDQVKLDQ